MMQNKENNSVEIPEYVRKLRKEGDLRLTLFGAITLSPFSKKTILKARDYYRRAAATDIYIQKPYNYFLATCMAVAKEYDRTPDWDLSITLAEKYGVNHAVRVTEDDEFLSDSPLSIKKAIDAQLRQKGKKYSKNDRPPRGPDFDGDTYIKHGKTYLRPRDSQEWEKSDAVERQNKPPEYWQHEKQKFLQLAHDGKVDLKGLKFLIEAGIIEPLSEQPPIECILIESEQIHTHDFPVNNVDLPAPIMIPLLQNRTFTNVFMERRQ